MTTAFAWKRPEAMPELGADEAHVWRVSWREGDFEHNRAVLDAAERKRAEAFRFARDREAFASTRAASRRLLGACLGVAPEAVRFEVGPAGKPALAVETGRVYFNVSHSGSEALVAIARREVGVDVELCRAEVEFLALAGRFFAKAEEAAVGGVEGEDRRAVFFRCWARKEACVKAVGLGLQVELDRFVVPTQEDLEPTPVQLPLEEAAVVTLLPVPAIAGYATALAVRGAAPAAVRYWMYSARA